MADRQPYLGKQATQTGRTPYLGPQKANTQRTPYLGGKTQTTAATTKKGGGGILGAVTGGAHWIAKKSELAAHDIKQIPGGIIDLGDAEYKAVKNSVEHPWVTGKQKQDLLHEWEHPLAPPRKGSGDADAARLVQGMEKGFVTSVKHPLRDPFQTLLNVGGLGRGVAGVAGRGAAVAREGSLAAGLKPFEPAPRLLKVGDSQMPLHASKNPLVRGAQAVHDKVVQKAIDTKPEGRVASYGTKRVGGSLDETARYQQRMRDVPSHLLQASAKKLSKLPGAKRVNQAALELTSVNTGPKEAAAYHLAQAEKGVAPELNRAVAKLYETVDKRGMLTKNESGDVIVNHADHPKLAQADLALAKVQGNGDEILARYGVRTPEELQAAIDSPGRYRAGATYEKPTPSKAGVSPALERAVKQRDALQRRFDETSKKQSGRLVEKPMTLDEAKAEHSRLDMEHQKALDKMAANLFGPIDRSEVNFRTRENARAARQANGKGGAAAWKSTKRPTVKNERRDQAEKIIADLVEKNPTHPTAKQWGDRMQRLAQLKGALEPEIFEKVDKSLLPTKQVYAPSTKHLERIGGALSVANDRVQQLERGLHGYTDDKGVVHPGKVKETGVIGGDTARPGRGHVSYASSEKKAPTSAAAASAGPVVGEANAPITSHANTGFNLEHGKVPNNVTGQAARHYHQIVRFVNTTERRNDAIKTGAATRQTERDVLVKVPGEEHAKIPAAVEEILGKTKLTTDDVEGLHAALNAYREDMVPGLRDRFAADRQKGIGAAAPEGHVWVDKNVLGDLAKPGTGPRGGVARTVDKINSAITAATVYFKIGHVGTRVITNAATNIIQGSAAPAEIGRSVGLWKALSHEDRLRALAAAGQHGFDAMPHEGTGLTSRVAGAGANWWAKHADAPFRFNSIAYEARKAGFDTPAKFKAMLDKLERPNDFNMNAAEHAKIDWVAKRANRAQIAYDRLGEAEKRFVTRAVWFYPWIKGATMFGGHVVSEHPYKAAVLGAAGAEGRERQQQELGDVPSYEQGLFQWKGGTRPLVSDFSTFSPFATPADLLGAAARPSELAGFLNPVAGAGNSLINGVNANGGKTTTPLTDALAQIASTTPESQILTAYLGRNKDQSRRMFKTTPMSALARSLVGPGLPRKVNPDALHSAASRQRAGR